MIGQTQTQIDIIHEQRVGIDHINKLPFNIYFKQQIIYVYATIE